MKEFIEWTVTRRVAIADLSEKDRLDFLRAETAGQKMRRIVAIERNLPNANSTEPGGLVTDRQVRRVRF